MKQFVYIFIHIENWWVFCRAAVLDHGLFSVYSSPCQISFHTATSSLHYNKQDSLALCLKCCIGFLLSINKINFLNRDTCGPTQSVHVIIPWFHFPLVALNFSPFSEHSAPCSGLSCFLATKSFTLSALLLTDSYSFITDFQSHFSVASWLLQSCLVGYTPLWLP